LRYHKNSDLLKINEQLIAIFDDRIQILNDESNRSETFNIQSLIDSEEKSMELKLRKVKLEENLSEIRRKITAIVGGSTTINFNKDVIFSVNEIAKKVNETLWSDSLNRYIKEQLIKTDIAGKRYELEEAKNKDYLSFFKADYDSSKNSFKKAFSVGVGIKIPFINGDQTAINRRKVNHLEAELDLIEKKKKFHNKLNTLIKSINRLALQYGIITGEKENGNATQSFKEYLKIDGIDPLTLLKIKESLLKSEIREKNVLYSIQNKFIELRDVSGMILFEKEEAL